MLTFRGGSDVHISTCPNGSRRVWRSWCRAEGAELVSEEEARAAIQRGEKIVIDDIASPTDWADLRVKEELAHKPPWYPVVLGYREAGMFVNYLRETDRPAFDRMMKAILDDQSFKDAVN